MKTLRAYVFETNSSSAHSITFSSQFPGNQTDGKLLVTGDGDFGWGYEELATPTEKMNYALIAYAYICSGEEECEQVLSEIKRGFATYGVEVIFEGEYYGKQQARQVGGETLSGSHWFCHPCEGHPHGPLLRPLARPDAQTPPVAGLGILSILGYIICINRI
mgnify:CR=1 FL=1